MSDLLDFLDDPSPSEPNRNVATSFANAPADDDWADFITSDTSQSAKECAHLPHPSDTSIELSDISATQKSHTTIAVSAAVEATEASEEADEWAGFTAQPAAQPQPQPQPPTTTELATEPVAVSAAVEATEASEEADDDWAAFEGAAESVAPVSAAAVAEEANVAGGDPSVASSTSATVLGDDAQRLLSLLESASGAAEDAQRLAASLSQWQHFAQLLTAPGPLAGPGDAAMPVICVPRTLRPAAERAAAAAARSDEHREASAAGLQRVSDRLDAKALDAQLERLRLLPHPLPLSSPANAPSSSAATAPSLARRPVRGGSGWQRSIARLSVLSASRSQDVADADGDDGGVGVGGARGALLNKQVSLTLQAAASSGAAAAAAPAAPPPPPPPHDPWVSGPDDEDEDDDWGGFAAADAAPAAPAAAAATAPSPQSAAPPPRWLDALAQLPDLSFVLAS